VTRFGLHSTQLLDAEEIVAQLLAVVDGPPADGGDVNHALGLEGAPRAGRARLEVLSEFCRVDVLVPVVRPGGHDPDEGCFGDDFRCDEAQGRACDGGAD